MVRRYGSLLGATSLTACVATAADYVRVNVHDMKDVYVADFQSEDIAHCRPADVDLGHRQAHQFFERAKQVDGKTLHDYYEQAPCYIEGTLRY